MRIRAISNRLVVKRVASETTHKGIILAKAEKDQNQEGVVVSVGPGKTNEFGVFIPTAVKEGDIVYFGKYSGSPYELDGVEYLFLSEQEVLGVKND